MVVGNSAGFALGSLKSHPLTMSLTHCTTEREAKCSKLGHICLHTKVPTLLRGPTNRGSGNRTPVGSRLNLFQRLLSFDIFM